MKPRLAITIGDPAGIGPEVALRCAADHEVQRQCIPILLGDVDVLRMIAERLGCALPSNVIERSDGLEQLESVAEPTIVDYETDFQFLSAGHANEQTGWASYRYVCDAIDAAINRHVHAVVTGPIQKEAWNAAGVDFPGHTELLAEKTATDSYCMMLTSEVISCALVTAHIGLAQVSGTLSIERVRETIELAHGVISSQLNRSARVAVCGLNPHAGESGMFGSEEHRVIIPAIQLARSAGIQVTGPVPADTAFVPAMRSETDVYVCMYHDQGLIPLKTLAFDTAVNVTLGLPIVRTSVDHGTAMDIAWQGIASPNSMKHAIAMAASLGMHSSKLGVSWSR